jgi:hypothetical protein
MTGNNLAKTRKGLWVSKAGKDVTVVGNMDMAFSSDLKSPKVVVAGSVTISPRNGYRAKDSGRPGIQNVTPIPFGRTINPYPAAFLIGSAPAWVLPLIGGGEMLPYLDNKWHTPVYEDCGGTAPNVLDTTYGTAIWKVSDSAGGDGNGVSQIWKCCALYPRVFADRLEIVSACSSLLTVKYLVLDYSF